MISSWFLFTFHTETFFFSWVVYNLMDLNVIITPESQIINDMNQNKQFPILNLLYQMFQQQLGLFALTPNAFRDRICQYFMYSKTVCACFFLHWNLLYLANTGRERNIRIKPQTTQRVMITPPHAGEGSYSTRHFRSFTDLF